MHGDELLEDDNSIDAEQRHGQADDRAVGGVIVAPAVANITSYNAQRCLTLARARAGACGAAMATAAVRMCTQVTGQCVWIALSETLTVSTYDST